MTEKERKIWEIEYVKTAEALMLKNPQKQIALQNLAKEWDKLNTSLSVQDDIAEE